MLHKIFHVFNFRQKRSSTKNFNDENFTIYSIYTIHCTYLRFNSQVVVELQGDLVGANGPRDFSVKKLLIPSLKVWKFDENPEPPAAYTVGPSL